MKMSKVAAVAMLVALSAAAGLSQTKTPSIDAREHRQQQRIEQGAKSGQLTNSEIRTLERQEGRIKSDEMIAKSDGKVTPAERHKLQRELNHESNRIYRKKHNDRTKG